MRLSGSLPLSSPGLSFLNASVEIKKRIKSVWPKPSFENCLEDIKEVRGEGESLIKLSYTNDILGRVRRTDILFTVELKCELIEFESYLSLMLEDETSGLVLNLPREYLHARLHDFDAWIKFAL